MRNTQPETDQLQDSKKPERSRGPVGLWLYGALTILGGLALIVVTE